MKTLLISLTMFITIISYAQEETHLQGTATENQQENNDIRQVGNLVRESMMEVLIYPNPAQGNFTISGSEGAKVTIYSEKGTYVGTWEIPAGQQLSFDDLGSGMYICSILKDQQRIVKKIVVL